jgi:DMSO/TMAO reductase YedYZ molybdopterin-dependent catalytic subunit
MAQSNGNDGTKDRFPTVGDGSGLAPGPQFYREEVQLALRNRGMPLEGMRYPVTPTGMHYLLVHFDIPDVRSADWRLQVGGLVSNPLSLALEEIKSQAARTATVTMECAGNGRALLSPRPVSQPWLVEAVGTAQWTGIPLRRVLAQAGVKPEAAELVFTGLDQGVQGGEVQLYQRSLTVAEASREEVLLAYEMNGEPLQPQHGYPLRLIVPGWYGMTSVKWLASIEAVAQPFQGYQMSQAYRISHGAEDPGNPVTRIRVRALMIPPGVPDFLTRTRLVAAGTVPLRGRAWAGGVGIAKVEVSDDGGGRWHEAQLEREVSVYSWRGWTFQWRARRGRHSLLVRATDARGEVQPVEQPWNFQGMANNMAQRVEVVVE